MVSPAQETISRIVFRVDASLEIGTGHVMRCLTLAMLLREGGTECYFICRSHPGHLINLIVAQGFSVYQLSEPVSDYERYIPKKINTLFHAHWLGVPWQVDADQCKAYIEELSPDWLVVDHYALDSCWEEAACPVNTRLLVIDDLADREHLADILLDQNLGRKIGDYTALVPAHCCHLIGPEFALLRPEFGQWRGVSLERRRQQPNLNRLLISLGGVDKDNVTGQILEALKKCNLPNECEISVIMGASSPWLSEVKVQVNELPWATEIAVGISDMGRRMAEADLAIGAAGSTSWERCCLGLPTLMVVLADNQQEIAEYLEMVGASLTLSIDSLQASLQNGLLKMGKPNALIYASDCCARVTDGNGAGRVIKRLVTNLISE